MTWLVDNVSSQQVTLDCTSSGRGYQKATQLLFDGEVFANAIALTSWDAESIQVVVCSACGTEHCEPGGWVALRSIGDLRLFVPLFGDWPGNEEYAPPEVVVRRGAPLLTPQRYRETRALVPDLPEHATPLTPDEAVALFWFEAPSPSRRGRDLPDLRRQLLAIAEHDIERAADDLARVLECLAATDIRLVSRPLEPDDRPITFYLNNAAFQEWTPIVVTPTGPALFYSGWVVGPSLA